MDGDARAARALRAARAPLRAHGRAGEAHAQAALRARLARLRPARAQAGAGRGGRDDGHRGHRAARQHARDRGVHAGRQRGGGGEAVERRRRARSIRIHEQPDPERVEEFCDLVASFGYRVPAEPRGDPAGGLPAHPAPDRGQARGEARLLPAAAHHEAGALPRGEPRPLRPGHRDVRALHEPDPPLSRPRRAPRAARAAPAAASGRLEPQRARCPRWAGTSPRGSAARPRPSAS